MSLLPFAFDLSRQNDSNPLPTVTQYSTTDKELELPKTNQQFEVENGQSSRRSSHEFLYSSLNSSSSAIIGPNGEILNYENTSSTVINFDPNNDFSSDNFDGHLGSNNLDIPSSPLIEPQLGVFLEKEPFKSDAFDDIVATKTPTDSKHSIPSSPTLLQSQTETSKFLRPKLAKHVHSISRHGSTFAEPSKKKQRQKISFREETLSQHGGNQIEFAIDRDGLVYGYHLEKAELPSNYSPSSYDEPTYFVVKNSAEQESKISKIVNDAFDQVLNPKNPIMVIDLQNMGLNSLPDSICDINDCYQFSEQGLIKSINHVNASNNMLRSINPKLFTTERLEMLSLRNNKIARLSGNIDKAKSLKELNLSMNKLKFLPHNILKLDNLEVLAISGNPMISENIVDQYFLVDQDLVKLYCEKYKSLEFKDFDKQIKSFTKLHWMKSNKQISKQSVRASILSRSLTTLQDMCMDSNGLISDYHDDFQMNDNILQIRSEAQKVLELQTPNSPRLSELALRAISEYRISQSEISNWKKSTSEIIYKRVMNALIFGTHGETCGYCENNCVESVAEIFEWWDFKGSQSVTIKRRFCSKNCAYSWYDKLKMIKYVDRK
ncbi:hypothetical protein CANINC_002288 [Pichia inconspicua]|uniref:Uncharacterized protein n=1 Tax=Pichia inconspicua TaxID=52247 RepID=A0A4T0X1J0_9ASCO|nr:hypothetical protein CANINC_002288 [[Candida] inconspicua]